jgi:hypothetical protein
MSEARIRKAVFLDLVGTHALSGPLGSGLRSIVFAAVALCFAATASAQDRAGSVYVIGGIALLHQDGATGETPQTYVTAPGGWTRGWLVGGGVFVASPVSVEVEWSRTGVMAARQPSRYGMTFNEERRDQFVSFAARFYLPRAGAVRVEPVAGLVITRPEAWFQTEYYMYWMTPLERLVREPRQQHRLDTNVGVTLGCDVRIGSRRMALLPSFRLSDTGVSHGFYGDSSHHREIGEIYPGGYPKWTVRSGVAVRVDF